MAVDAAAGVGRLSSSDDDPHGDSTELPPADNEVTMGVIEAGDVVDHEDDTDKVAEDDEDRPGQTDRSLSPLLLAGIAGTITVVVLGALTGWLGYRAYGAHQEKEERALFLQVARQGAVNLSTIDYQHADADVHRILDSATGQFHDEFAQRSQSFADMVTMGKSVSKGTVAEAGLESVTGDEARALVAVSVTSSVAGGPQQQPRSWRMRLTLQKSGNDVKISNVEFVP